MRKTLRILLIGFVLSMMIIGVAAAVYATPSIQWNTENIYYDSSGTLVIDGYFFNNGTRTIHWVDSHKVRVYFRTRNQDWWLQAETIFFDLNVNIRPGEASHWTLKITNVDYEYFEYWLVEWETNFRYL